MGLASPALSTLIADNSGSLQLARGGPGVHHRRCVLRLSQIATPLVSRCSICGSPMWSQQMPIADEISHRHNAKQPARNSWREENFLAPCPKVLVTPRHDLTARDSTIAVLCLAASHL